MSRDLQENALVVIYVRGGVVQDVECPEGVSYEVIDYDNTPELDQLPFGGSHAPDCTYRLGHAVECNCWRSDPKQNPELVDADDTCPVDGKDHRPNWKSVSIEQDGGETYIDVTCVKCGRSGCVGTTKTLGDGINW